MKAWDVWIPQGATREEIRSSAVPKFHRVRRVCVIPGATRLSCSCCRFESIVLPCVHQSTVLTKEFPDWDLFSHQDVSVRWWRIYAKYGYSSECVDLASLMEKIRLKPQRRYTPAVVDKPALESVVNYTQQELRQLIPNYFRIWTSKIDL
jgi:hypothetical protein